ncbi:MAG TPA: ATP-binding protein [Nitrososphaera sp.]|nr:ATP-binding protein [Nitrososphaera sp.]
MNGILSRKNLMLVVLVVSVAASISAISYEYSLYTSQQIEELAVQEIRSNSDIQAHDLANSFSNKMGDIVDTLQIISQARSVREGNLENAKPMFNQAGDSSPEIIDFYMWLDSEGRLVWLSNINQTAYEQYRNTDLSYRLYFITPQDTHQLYYSSVIDSNDRVARLYITYPILGESEEFRGIVAAGLRSDAIGDFLQSQLSPKLQGEVVMLDNTGIVLYSKDPQYVGRNVFGIRFQSLLASSDVETLGAMNEGFTDALAGNEGTKDVTLNGEKATFVYKPIILEGKQFGVLYILTPHAYASNVAGLVEQQKNFSLMLIVITSAAAIGTILVILTWNKRLEQTVNTKTSELTVANEQLKAHDKMQREFINIAAHELRTPIQPILGVAEMLEDELGDKKEDIRMIARNARRLERLTRDLLDVAKIEGQSLKLIREKFSMSELISVLVQDYRKRLADGHDTVIEYESEGDIVVEADRERIAQVISNLLDNALKFTKNGKIVITTKKEDGGKVSVSVQDTGTGMELEIIPRLFTKFASRSQSGTGLGLFISKSIIEAHGGEIWGKNNESKGATFTFTIPDK